METPAIRAIEPSIAKPVSLNRRAMIAPTRSENRAAIRGLFRSHSPDQMERGLLTQIAAPTTRTIKIREGTSKNLTWPSWMATLRPSIGRNLDIPPVSYTHLRAHETRHDLVCRLLLEKKKKK